MAKEIKGKEKFLEVYSQLPLAERKNVVIVLDDEPISWNRAYRQIENNTKIGEKIFKLLEELEII